MVHIMQVSFYKPRQGIDTHLKLEFPPDFPNFNMVNLSRAPSQLSFGPADHSALQTSLRFSVGKFMVLNIKTFSQYDFDHSRPSSPDPGCPQSVTVMPLADFNETYVSQCIQLSANLIHDLERFWGKQTHIVVSGDYLTIRNLLKASIAKSLDEAESSPQLVPCTFPPRLNLTTRDLTFF
jgi:hypothetical protein